MKTFCILILFFASFTACSGKTKVVETETTKIITVEDPGAVDYIYEPPVVDVVDVPPGLDPEGIYYRPSHEEVVEVRQGRWRYKKATDLETTKTKIKETKE